MIRFRDATVLALTKLRTRKVRLIVTIVISGLLFSGLAGVSSVMRGVFSSVNDFNKEALGERYIVEAQPQEKTGFYDNQEIVDRALAIHKDVTSRKTTEAKRLGVDYSSSMDISPVNEYETPNGKQRFLNSEAPSARQAIAEHVAANPGPGRQAIEKLATTYGAKAVYESRTIPYSLDGQRLTVIKDGKETTGSEKRMDGMSIGVDSFLSSWTLMSTELLEPFILPGQNLTTDADGTLPIIVPNKAAEQLSGLKALSATATSAEILEHTKQLRTAVQNVKFEVCYRNATSASLLDQAVTVNQEIAKNKDKKDYTPPALVYGTPADACGAVEVATDKRTAEQKTYDAKQLQFSQQFGQTAAKQEKIKFRVVGIVPDPPEFGSMGISSIIGTLVTSSLGSGWYAPIDDALKNPTIASIFPAVANGNNSLPAYRLEFATSQAARDIMQRESCEPEYPSGPMMESFNPYKACEAAGKYFSVAPYGSNSLALESVKKGFGKFFTIAAAIVAGIAAIIMMGTVGRMIADSRRETAVFRAIGATKLDIAQIYLIYTTMLSLLIAAFSLLVGLVMGLIVHAKFSNEVTAQALVAYNAQDLTRKFDLYTLYVPDALMLLGLALAVGLLSAALPLVRNLRRNPIRDMRDDT